MLFRTEDVVLLKVRHNVAGNNVFQQLAGSTGKGDRPVINGFVAFTFSEGWCDNGSFPVFGEYSVLVGGSKEESRMHRSHRQQCAGAAV